MKIFENFQWKSQEKELENDKFIILSDDFGKIKINLNTWEKEYKKPHINDRCFFNAGVGFCLLPRNVLFCHGFINTLPEKMEWKAYLINENLDIQILPIGRSCYGIIAEYHNKFVYIFGYASLERFNLIKWKWEKLIKTACLCNWCSSVSFNDFILVSRYDSTEIFVLDLLICSFSWTPCFLEQKKTKILCKSEYVAYIIETSGKIFESEIFNPFEWSVIGNFNPSVFNAYGCKSFYRNCWYFMLDRNIMKFDLDKKEIEKSTVLSIYHILYANNNIEIIKN